MLFDAPPSIGHNLQRAVNDIAAAEGVSNTVTHLVYTHHHSDHAGASSLFTVPTAFSILESIRLDLGYRMDVHRSYKK